MAFSKSGALDLFRRAHAQNRLAHAYLLSGSAGSGKRDLAAGLSALVLGVPAAKALAHPDTHIAEPESKSRRIKVDQLRALERELQMRATSAACKVAIIFDADRLMPAASNAFLKTLEEPPANSLLILTTAHPEQLLDTIISRCIPVPLLAAEAPPPTARQNQLLDSLEAFFSRKTAGVTEVFQLIRVFQGLLREMKDEIQATHAAELKKEEQLYKQTTEGDWLDDREDYYKALTESHYIRERSALVEVVMQWWADILRHQQGYSRLDLASHSSSTARLAAEFETQDLLKRIAAIEELRDILNRNVQETLAIEATFLKAFSRD